MCTRKGVIANVGRLKKFVESLGAELRKECDTGSTYYTYESKKIRISDHVGSCVDCVSVIPVQRTQEIIIVYDGVPRILKTMKEAKAYLESYLFMCENKSMKVKIRTKKQKKLEKKNEELSRAVIEKDKQIKKLEASISVLEVKGSFDEEDLTPKQKKALANMMKMFITTNAENAKNASK